MKIIIECTAEEAATFAIAMQKQPESVDINVSTSNLEDALCAATQMKPEVAGARQLSCD